MTWATSTTGFVSESSSLSGALPPVSAPSTVLTAVPGALWRDDEAWDGSSIVVVDPGGMRAVGTAAAARGYLWVPITPPRPAQRGRLALHIEECIECALEQRGAPPPGISASTHLDASLSDQLYRARFLEMRGIAVGIPSLEGIANLGRVLDAEDSAVLRWWLASTSDRPLCVVLSTENRSLRVYPSPVAFKTLIEGVAPPTPRAPSVETAQSVVAMELSDLPPSVADIDDEPVSLADGVELPDLDRALGLSPLLGPVETSTSSADENLEAAALAAPAPVEAAQIEASAEVVQASTLAEAIRESVAAESLAVEASAIEASPTEEAVESAPSEVAPASSLASSSEAEAVIEASDIVERAVMAAESVVVAAPAACEPVEAAPVEPMVVVEPTVVAASSAVEPTVVAAPIDAPLAPLPIKTLVSPRLLAQKSRPVDAPVPSPSEVTRPEPSFAAELPAMELDDEEDAPRFVAEPSPSTLAAAQPRKRSPFMIMPAELNEEAAPLVGDAPEAPEAPEVKAPIPTLSPAPASLVSLSPTLRERMPLQRSALKPLRPRVAPPKSDEPTTLPAPAPSEPAQLAPSLAAEAEPVRAALVVAPPAAPSEPDPFDAFARDNWRTWVKDLEAARGPKPLAVIERMFVTAYMRLDAALERKIADQSAREAMDAWRDSFEKSYTEAFDALRVRGKRPTMVLDIPDLAQRMGRLHGARRVQLLLVDGLRFDLGMMIQDRLKSGGQATLAERLLLWSALPANTATQIELIGRGPDGLKDKDMPVETPAVVARGRAAHALRRIRTGRRELFKLDIVESSLREGEGKVRERLVTIADDVATSINDHFSKQPPRTLVMVFGDHGFRIEGETKVTQGGATPEEVLVPAFAWLTGATH